MRQLWQAWQYGLLIFCFSEVLHHVSRQRDNGVRQGCDAFFCRVKQVSDEGTFETSISTQSTTRRYIQKEFYFLEAPSKILVWCFVLHSAIFFNP